MIRKDLPDLDDILMGSLFKRYTRCMREGCKCRRGKKHGPYFYFSFVKGGRIHQIYIPRHKVGEVRRKIGNYRKLMRFIERRCYSNIKKLKEVE